jgi:deoxyribonuclease-1
MKNLILLCCLFFFSFNIEAGNTKVASFGSAKSELAKVYGNKSKTFYCNCDYQKKSIILKGCNLKLKRYKKRSKRLEWEHIVPAHAFGQSFKEWRDSKTICGVKKSKSGKIKKVSGRKCASKKNKLFRLMEADIYNLVPAIGSINAMRSNYSMAEISEKKELCSTDLRIAKRKIMPPTSRRGDVARIYMYMHQEYPGRGIISKKNESLFKKWDNEDPISPEECTIYLKKKAIQGNLNLILESQCQVK